MQPDTGRRKAAMPKKDETPRPSGINLGMCSLFRTGKSIEVISYIHRIKDRGHIIISVKPEKVLSKPSTLS